MLGVLDFTSYLAADDYRVTTWLGHNNVEYVRLRPGTLRVPDFVTKLIITGGPLLVAEAPALQLLCKRIRDENESGPGRVSVLGICLGALALAQAYGAELVPLSPSYHGLVPMDHKYVFLPNPAPVLAAHQERIAELPPCFFEVGRHGSEPIAFYHTRHNVQGVVFHPETDLNSPILRNFLEFLP